MALSCWLCCVSSWLWWLCSPVFMVFGAVSVTTFLLIQLPRLLGTQNLKQKYEAEWALVTGSSSGIGKAIAERFAEQGLNVVLVAKDDDFFTKTFAELQAKYKSVTFRKVAVNLGVHGGYMQQITDATSDITVQIICNNAGYILPGLFHDQGVEAVQSNYECNATAAMLITHHYSRKLVEQRKRGLITFTSSAAAYFPGPTASLYASTKAFMTSFATSIAAEFRDVGVDIVVVHPSPIASSFYSGTRDVLGSLKSAEKAAASPFEIADAILRAAGRVVVWDHGSTSMVFRLVVKLVDFAFFNELTSRIAYIANPDHKALAAKSALRNPKKKE